MIKKEVVLLVFGLLFISFVSAESLFIRNLGQVGFNDTSSDYTSITTVILDLAVNSSATNCSCGNFDGVNLTYDIWNYTTFSYWRSCDFYDYWLINSTLLGSESDKFVRCLINHTNGIVTLVHDSITYDPLGYGLDTTPPSTFNLYGLSDTVTISENETLFFNWSDSFDSESTILKIPLTYSYRVLVDSIVVVNWTSVGFETSALLNFGNELLLPSSIFSDGDNVSIQVRAENSANLYTVVSKNMNLDMHGPIIVDIESSTVLNNTWNSYLDNLSDNSVFFNWSASDLLSDVVAYSFILTKNISEEPDIIPEGTIGSFDSKTEQLYSNLKVVVSEGMNYFKVRAKDSAGNWGPSQVFYLGVDNLPPQTPIIYDQGLNISHQQAEYIGIIFNWSVVDLGCGVVDNFVEVDDDSDFQSPAFSGFTGSSDTYFNFSTLNDGIYYIRVKAMDCMGSLSSFSDLTKTIKQAESFLILDYGPTGEVATKNPYLFVKTSRISNCYYKFSTEEEYTLFEFTNETSSYSPISLNHTSYFVNVKCVDLLNETRSVVMEFDVLEEYFVSSVTLYSLKNNFYPEEKVSYSVKLSPSVSQIPLEDFTFYLNDKRYSDYVINEITPGNFILSFYAPTTIGDYDFYLEIKNVESNTISFSVEEPFLSISLDSSNIRSFDVDVSDFGNVLFALGAEYSVGISGAGDDLEIDTSDFSVNLPLDRDGYIFLTESNFDASKREDALYYGGFTKLLDPSFGFLAEGVFDLNFILSMDDVVLLTDYLSLSGTDSLSIRNLGKDVFGRKQVFVSSVKTQNFTGENS